ncbi:methylaspartate ammonia-lyase, partial [Bordetella pertussis]
MKPMQQDVPPIRIEAVRVTAGIGGHWINDQMAVQTGATADGYFFEGPTSSTAFPAVRSPSVAYLVSLDLADGQTAHGDCTTVANAGYAGRPLPLRREDVQAVQAV